MDLKQAARAELEKRGIRIDEGKSESNPAKEAALAELQRRGVSLSEPEESVGRSFARGAKNVSTGLLDTADFLGTPVREAVNLGSRALGSDYRMQPMGQMTSEAVDRATSGYTKAHTPTQKVEEAVQRGGASLLSGSGIGNVASKSLGTLGRLGKVLKESHVVTGRNVAATGATAGTAQHYVNENPGDELGALAAGFGAGLGTHGMASALTKAGRQSAARGTGRALGVSPEKLKDFEKAGVSPTLADVSTGRIPKVAENVFSYMPGPSGVLSKARGTQREQILNALNQGEKGLDLSSLSKLTTKGVKNYKGAKDATHKELFGRVEADINRLKNPAVPLSKVHEVSAELSKHGLDPKEFSRTPVGKFLNKIHSQTGKEGIPYYKAKHILDGLNDAITTHGTIGKVTQGRLKHLRNALKDDIEDGLGIKLKELGPESHKNWKEARKSYALYADEDIANINDLLKSGKKGATDAFINMMANTKKGAEKAQMVLKSLPEKEAHKLVNGITHQLGSYKNEFSPVRWATGFRSLDKPAQDLLLEYLPKNQTKAVQKSVEHLKSTLNEANTSKTTVHQALIDYAKKAGKFATAAAAGSFAGLPSSALVLGASYGASKAMTNQKLIKLLSKGVESKAPKNQSAVLTQLIRSANDHRSHHAKGDVVKKTAANDPIAAIYANTKRMTGDRGKDLANDIASFQGILNGAKKGSDLYKRAQMQVKAMQGQLDDFNHPDTPEQIAAFKKSISPKPIVNDVNGKDGILDLYDRHGIPMLSNEKKRYQDLLDAAKTTNPLNPQSGQIQTQLRSMQSQFMEDAKDQLGNQAASDPAISAYNQNLATMAANRAANDKRALKQNARYHVINAANSDDKHYGKSNAALKPMQDAMKQASQLNRIAASDEFKQMDPYQQAQLQQARQQANAQQKQAMDQYYGLEGSEHTAEVKRQDQLDKERADPWNFIKKIPVFGQIMSGLNTVTGGAIKSFSHAGSNLFTGHVKDAFSDLGNGLLTGAQFAMNPISGTVQNVGSALADKYLPGVMSSILGGGAQQEDDSSDQSGDDSADQGPYQAQPDYSSYQPQQQDQYSSSQDDQSPGYNQDYDAQDQSYGNYQQQSPYGYGQQYTPNADDFTGDY